MILEFTVEEINLMSIFDTSGKNALITELTAAIPDFTEPELTDIADNIIIKLGKMTEAEFLMLKLYPQYD